jgi:hypothetical protein
MKLNLKLWHLLTIQFFLLASLVWAANSRITDLTELTDGNVAAGDLVECVDVSDTTDNAAGSSRKCTVASLETAIHAAGSATAGSWPKFGSGTVQTTPDDDSLENDGNAFYITTDAGNRGYVSVKHCTRQAASRTLTSSASEQALFDAAQDTLTLETGTYFFDGMVYVTGLSATSGNYAFDFIGAGTATAADILYHGWGIDNTTLTNAGTTTQSYTITQQSAASVVTGGTGTGAAVTLRGTFEVTGAGTLIPSVTLVTAAAGTVAAGTFFCVERWGATGVTTVGQWN